MSVWTNDIRKVNCVLLEDSDLQFDNIFSLVFHYSQVCEELPCLLALPSVLATAESYQALEAFSLLGRGASPTTPFLTSYVSDFWKYPMSKPGRRSLLLSDCPSDPRHRPSRQESYASQAELYISEDRSLSDLTELSARLNRQLEELTSEVKDDEPERVEAPLVSTPPRPPRRSCGRLDTPTTSPLSTPPARQRRRVSDSAVAPLTRVQPARVGPRQRHSLAGRDYHHVHGHRHVQGKGCVSSPVSNPGSGGRQRKQSVFVVRKILLSSPPDY